MPSLVDTLAALAGWNQFNFHDLKARRAASVSESPDAVEDQAIRPRGQFVPAFMYGRINREILQAVDFLETTVAVRICRRLVAVKIASEHAGELAVGIRNSNSEAHGCF